MKEEERQDRDALPEGQIPVRLPKPPKRGWRLLVTLLLCGALFVAAFGLGLLLQTKNRIPAFLTDWFAGEKTDSEATSEPQMEKPQEEPAKSNPENESKETLTPENTIPVGAIPIRKETFSGANALQNRSTFSIENIEKSLSKAESAAGKEPLVLILCTHSSECYAKGEFVVSPIGNAIYSDDPEAGVLAVAGTLAKSLGERGIKTVFSDSQYDMPTIAGAYRRAGEHISRFLEEYPGIRYVIDLHREEIIGADGALIGCIAEKDGTDFAQISMLVGTNGDGSAEYPWEENLALAERIGEGLNEAVPGIFRSVTLENSPYNQNLAAHSLLIKIGAAGNSVEEANRSAILFAEVFAEYLLEK
ncbi:MAG: stage II sporulation protein P [Clostridia bacterium]|nr:stage II sporulation protein P [Clostridia bacterium]